LYISAGLFLFMCVIQGGIIIYQNGFFRYGRARAHITHVYGAVRLRIQLQKPLDVKAGQHINLWIPSVSFWSFLQSHPFVVISWAEKPQDHLDLFIEPRRGLTRELLSHAKNGHAMNSLVLFSRPHGKSVPMDDCENILMVASGFGIAAQLPYLKRLIHGYNARKLRARRVHLVWQVRNIGKLLTGIIFIKTKI
jgi:NAD(P)H-flavin reductase